jgi:hypothetical protein
MVTPDLGEPTLTAFNCVDGERVIPCNLYCIPVKIFQADVQRLTYGGFYSHKFAFSFQLLAQGGRVFNPADFFWISETSRLARLRFATKTVAELVQRVHRDIFHYHPFVGRAMTKFLTNPHAVVQLQRYVAERVKKPLSGGVADASESEWCSCAEKSVYRFWEEYTKFKSPCAGETWPESVRRKMIQSLGESDFALINRYLYDGTSSRPAKKTKNR